MHDWVESVILWAPLLIIVAVFVYFGRKQMRDYRGHLDHVAAINNEILELNRKNREISYEQLGVLKQIKSLLEDRKS